MAKKGASKGYVSSGSVGTNRALSNSIRAERHPADVFLNKMKAFRQGKKVYITIDNPDKTQTNRRRIRVPMSQIFGDFREYNKKVSGR